jgi:5-methylcytosine-specific restriction protein B
VRKGDLVFGYQSTPDKKLVAIAQVCRELFANAEGEQCIEIEAVAKVADGLTYEELQKDSILAASEPLRFRCQGTLFALTEDELDHLVVLLTEKDPELRRHLDTGETVGPLTRLTFHASYSYEDFIEGYRPTDGKAGHLSLRLEDGIFKRVCREAQANPKKPYLVFIDEINRANVAKVLGELITLLEKDKRGLMVSLPQSKEPFTIPDNVYVLGTMNTADRSIKLLDAALRRRFAFIELMPDSSLLQGGKVGSLLLDDFLEKLNQRIAEKEGREKQIGHSFLMEGDGPVTDQEEFSRRFRQEILPLLQEYCYDDYRVLATYIGEELVDLKTQTLNEERLADPEQLIGALEEEFADEGTLA